MSTQKKYYAVAVGRRPGLYAAWYGPEGAEAQVKGFPGARYKGFPSRAEAAEWLKDCDKPTAVPAPGTSAKKKQPASVPPVPGKGQGRLVMYADGGCLDNPGPGGYGVVLLDGRQRKELTGGFRRTTNNRMELMACIAGLRALRAGKALTIFSDSSYVVNGMTRGWARKWQRNNWMRTDTEHAENADLWAALLELCDKHKVAFVWIKGHANNPENERCDQLARQAALAKNRPLDEGYEERQRRRHVGTSV